MQYIFNLIIFKLYLPVHFAFVEFLAKKKIEQKKNEKKTFFPYFFIKLISATEPDDTITEFKYDILRKATEIVNTSSPDALLPIVLKKHSQVTFFFFCSSKHVALKNHIY